MVILCIWAGESNGMTINDIPYDQFIFAVNFLETKLPFSIDYDDTATGDTFSEKLRNWEAYYINAKSKANN